MRHSWVLIILLSCAMSVARADGPTTLPSTQPAAFEADALARTWFVQLGSLDDANRDEARTNLMGLTRDDLPRLRALVAESRPLAAAQVAALHEIVLQVYLSGEPYPVESSHGFLGFSASRNPYERDRRLGVPIGTRILGFAGYRMLRDGDFVLGILLNSDLPVSDSPNLLTQDFETFKNAIARIGADRDVTFEVLRGGQHIHVTCRLQARPKFANANVPTEEMEAYCTERQQKAEEYWRREFVPLLRAGMS